MPPIKRILSRLPYPKTLLWQLALVMISGVLAAQMLGNFIWSWQTQNSAVNDAKVVAHQLGKAANDSVQYFQSLPENFRPVVLEQMREVGGTRFLISFNHDKIMNEEIKPSLLQGVIEQELEDTFSQINGDSHKVTFGFSHPDALVINDKQTKLIDLPPAWTQFSLLLEPKPAPVLVIQIPLDEDTWILLATLLPDPYLLEKQQGFGLDLLVPHIASLFGVLLVCFLAVQFITQPLNRLAQAAENFGKGFKVGDLPHSNTREIATTANAFKRMQQRIQQYLDDRQRLFAAISHDLRTPITRLKLRAELLDDEKIADAFHHDLDELDLMVKGALQIVKDTAIHEDKTYIGAAIWLQKLADNFNVKERVVTLKHPDDLSSSLSDVLSIKPLAMKRALSNIIDNGIKYGSKVEVSWLESALNVEIAIRDFGPGVDESELQSMYQPYVRLQHGKEMNNAGHGLGLSISQTIINAHGGDISVQNHAEGGLLVLVILPKD